MKIYYLYGEPKKGQKKGQMKGCVIQLPDGDTGHGHIGYSFCHPNDRGKFTKKLARKIALGRAEKCRIYRLEGHEYGFVKYRGIKYQTIPKIVCDVLYNLWQKEKICF